MNSWVKIAQKNLPADSESRSLSGAKKYTPTEIQTFLRKCEKFIQGSLCLQVPDEIAELLELAKISTVWDKDNVNCMNDLGLWKPFLLWTEMCSSSSGTFSFWTHIKPLFYFPEQNRDAGDVTDDNNNYSVEFGHDETAAETTAFYHNMLEDPYKPRLMVPLPVVDLAPATRCGMKVLKKISPAQF